MEPQVVREERESVGAYSEIPLRMRIRLKFRMPVDKRGIQRYLAKKDIEEQAQMHPIGHGLIIIDEETREVIYKPRTLFDKVVLSMHDLLYGDKKVFLSETVTKGDDPTWPYGSAFVWDTIPKSRT